MPFVVALVALCLLMAACASLDPPRSQARDYAAMSCKELAAEAKRLWHARHEQSTLFATKSEQRLAAEREQAKRDLKSVKRVAAEKECWLSS